MEKEQINIAEYALECALSHGCNEAEVQICHQQSNETRVNNGSLVSCSACDELELALTLYVNSRKSHVNTNRLNITDLKQFIIQSIEATKLLEEDPFAYLPDSEQLYHGDNSDLGLNDATFSTITQEERLERLFSIDTQAHKEHVISSTAAMNALSMTYFRATSNGFAATNSRTYYSLLLSLMAMNGDMRVEHSASTLESHFANLPNGVFADDAYQLLVSQFNTTRLRATSLPAVIDKHCANRILSPITNALSAQAIFYKRSFLANKIGEQIASNAFTLSDLPHRYGCLGADWFDTDGAPTTDLSLISDGVLKNYYVSHYYSRRLQTPRTMSGVISLLFHHDGRTTNELIATVQDGIYITHFNGGNCNPVTGDFSFGVSGFRIENGTTTTFFSGAIITGNMLSLMQNIAAFSSDTTNYDSHHPSILLNNITITH